MTVVNDLRTINGGWTGHTPDFTSEDQGRRLVCDQTVIVSQLQHSKVNSPEVIICDNIELYFESLTRCCVYKEMLLLTGPRGPKRATFNCSFTLFLTRLTRDK